MTTELFIDIDKAAFQDRPMTCQLHDQYWQAHGIIDSVNQALKRFNDAKGKLQSDVNHPKYAESQYRLELAFAILVARTKTLSQRSASLYAASEAAAQELADAHLSCAGADNSIICNNIQCGKELAYAAAALIHKIRFAHLSHLRYVHAGLYKIIQCIFKQRNLDASACVQEFIQDTSISLEEHRYDLLGGLYTACQTVASLIENAKTLKRKLRAAKSDLMAKSDSNNLQLWAQHQRQWDVAYLQIHTFCHKQIDGELETFLALIKEVETVFLTRSELYYSELELDDNQEQKIIVAHNLIYASHLYKTLFTLAEELRTLDVTAYPFPPEGHAGNRPFAGIREFHENPALSEDNPRIYITMSMQSGQITSSLPLEKDQMPPQPHQTWDEAVEHARFLHNAASGTFARMYNTRTKRWLAWDCGEKE